MGVIFLALFFAVSWAFAVALRAQVSGWVALAKRYRASEPFTGSTWTGQTARFRNTLYRGSVTVGADPRGLYLQAPSTYFLRHPPLLIPWSDIKLQGSNPDPEEGFTLELGPEIRIPFAFSESLAQKMRFVAGLSWPMSEDPTVE